MTETASPPRRSSPFLALRLCTRQQVQRLQSPLPITFQPVPGSDATPAEVARAAAVVADPAVIRRQIKYISSCVVAAPAPGTSLSVLVGLSSYSREELIANIAAVLRIVLDSRKPLIVGGWGNVRNMIIKTSESAGLPLYTAPTRSRDTENEIVTAPHRYCLDSVIWLLGSWCWRHSRHVWNIRIYRLSNRTTV